MADFKSFDDIEAWMAEKGGLEALKLALRTQLFSGPNGSMVRKYLAHLDDQEIARATAEMRRRAEEEQQLRAREVTAAETAATAAADAATHAKTSATWAKWAVLVAAAALVVSAWPYIMNLGR